MKLSAAMLRALEPYRDDPAHSESVEDARIPKRTADALVRRGLLELSTSPAGSEHWYITSAGRAALASSRASKRGADDTVASLGGRHGGGPRPPSAHEPKRPP